MSDGSRSDFWKFWAGQTISQLGSSFTAFALPLLVYKLTGSSVSLAIGTAAYFLPYLLFGLVIGAWVDRVDRRRMMIAVDLGRAARHRHHPDPLVRGRALRRVDLRAARSRSPR